MYKYCKKKKLNLNHKKILGGDAHDWHNNKNHMHIHVACYDSFDIAQRKHRASNRHVDGSDLIRQGSVTT